MAEAFLMIQYHGGYGQDGQLLRKTFDSALLQRANELRDQSNEVKDKFFSSLEQQYVSHHVISAISAFIGETSYKDAFAKDNRFGGIEEDFLFGVGLTKDDALLEFGKALSEAKDNESGDDWDGEDDED